MFLSVQQTVSLRTCCFTFSFYLGNSVLFFCSKCQLLQFIFFSFSPSASPLPGQRQHGMRCLSDTSDNNFPCVYDLRRSIQTMPRHSPLLPRHIHNQTTEPTLQQISINGQHQLLTRFSEISNH